MFEDLKLLSSSRRDFKLGEDLIDLGDIDIFSLNAFDSGNNLKLYIGNTDLLAVFYDNNLSDLNQYVSNLSGISDFF